jgi:hypothetical protein
VNLDQLAAAGVGAVVGGFIAFGVMRLRLATPHPALVRENVDGVAVPAVLGDSVIMGALLGLATLAILRAASIEPARIDEVGVAIAVLVTLLGAAGRFDDLRGDEQDRGFGGHLRAARGGRVTGGLLKLAAGGVAGLISGALVASDLADVLLIGAIVALAANLFNLFDRAPGRTCKLWILATAAIAVVGEPSWTVAASGMIGAVVVILPADLSARGMLGDAGANPMGAVWGLGLALPLGTAGRGVAAGVLLALNLASERWSFSNFIERTGPLRAFDRIGRTK